MQQNFTAIVFRVDDQWWHAECVEVDGAITQGHTRSEALANLEDAIGLTLEYRNEKLAKRFNRPFEMQNLSLKMT